MPRSRVEDLFMGAIDEKAEYYDWYASACDSMVSEYRYPEVWDIPFDISEEQEDDPDAYMPMMNFRYPIPLARGLPSDEEIKEKLSNAGSITLTYNQEEDKYYLALTGGGMDFTWHIARAYIQFGYAPPVEFCRLPDMGKYSYDQEVVDACRRSLEGMEERVASLRRDLDRLEKEYSEG